MRRPLAVYDVARRTVTVAGRTRRFPPLVPGSDDDPALAYAERVGRVFLVGLPPVERVLSESESAVKARAKRSRRKEHAYRLP